MELETGAIYEGKISHITKFGAFVALPEGKSGLVHISEIANGFISDINEHVHVGDGVKATLSSIPPFTPRHRPAADTYKSPEAPAPQVAAGPSDDEDFESKLKKFMQDSDSRIAGNPLYADRNRKSRRR